MPSVVVPEKPSDKVSVVVVVDSISILRCSNADYFKRVSLSVIKMAVIGHDLADGQVYSALERVTPTDFRCTGILDISNVGVAFIIAASTNSYYFIAC